MPLPVTDPTIRALQAHRAYHAEKVAYVDRAIADEIEREESEGRPGCASRCAFETHPNETAMAGSQAGRRRPNLFPSPKQQKILDLRESGMSLKAIGEANGVSPQYAHQVVKRWSKPAKASPTR